MITTPELVTLLATDVAPRRPLRPPLQRTALWLILAVGVFALLALGNGWRPDLAQKLAQPAFVAGILTSLLTGVLAAVASFMVCLPDRSRLWLLLPIPPLLAWLSTVGYGCLTDWVDMAPDGIRMGDAARCFATLLLISMPLSLGMYAMLRHAAWMRARAVTIVGSLAVAALAATGMMLFHDLNATAMVLIWNFGVAAIFLAVASIAAMRTREFC